MTIMMLLLLLLLMVMVVVVVVANGGDRDSGGDGDDDDEDDNDDDDDDDVSSNCLILNGIGDTSISKRRACAGQQRNRIELNYWAHRLMETKATKHRQTQKISIEMNFSDLQ
ncbi:hypothetical protein PoB_000746200 [Plakobranchus ocellatus]|uniref:Secreted protein n=1 Tax=Plakobranchus ocellatus TaxID=259542 RepID=A0AAV3YDJ5_9GAST|nr:hypothetical protein PoB_000746200 [Plakobranchus ocellatus]